MKRKHKIISNLRKRAQAYIKKTKAFFCTNLSQKKINQFKKSLYRWKLEHWDRKEDNLNYKERESFVDPDKAIWERKMRESFRRRKNALRQIRRRAKKKKIVRSSISKAKRYKRAA